MLALPMPRPFHGHLQGFHGSENLALVLLHDLLLKKRLKCGGPLKAALMRHKVCDGVCDGV
jgi:hypothetical protein